MNWPSWQSADDVWQLDHPRHFPDNLPALRNLEREANLIIEYAPWHVPELLQTTTYTQALLHTHPDIPPTAITEITAARQSRQQQLPTHPTTYIFYLQESVLHTTAGTPQITQEQLAFLLLTQSTNAATIRILPAATHFPTTPPFRLLHRNNAPPILHRDSPTNTTFTQQSPETDHHQSLTTRLNTTALTPADSQTLLHHTLTP